MVGTNVPIISFLTNATQDRVAKVMGSAIMEARNEGGDRDGFLPVKLAGHDSSYQTNPDDEGGADNAIV
jgi:hypothetical protein